MPSAFAYVRLNLAYCASEMARIRAGLIPQTMEDKWFVYWTHDNLYFHRSWTGFCIYIVGFERHGDAWRATGALVNRDPGQYKQTDDARDGTMVPYLIDALLLGKPAQFPWNERGLSISSPSPGVAYRFWRSRTYGLIRRRTFGHSYHPEIWRDGRWIVGSAYVMDAITGMGEDIYSCGEWAERLTVEAAEEYASANGVDPYGDDSDQPLPSP